MSLEALNRVWQSKQPGTKKLVLLLMAWRADEYGYVVGGADYLARLANISSRSVRRILKDLREANEIRLVHSGGGRASKVSDGFQPGDANVYQIVANMTPEEIASSEEKSDLLRAIRNNPDKLSPFNPDKLSPNLMLNNAAVFNSRKAAAAVNKGDKLSPLLGLVDKIDRQKSNPDKLSPLLKEQIRQVAEVALAAGWGGELGELARLLVNAAHAEMLNYPYGLQDALDDARTIGWRGNSDDLIRAWLQEPGRVENLIWYAQQKDWGGGLLRRALQSGEWPPELKPDSPAAWRVMQERYLNDPYAAFYANLPDPSLDTAEGAVSVGSTTPNTGKSHTQEV